MCLASLLTFNRQDDLHTKVSKKHETIGDLYKIKICLNYSAVKHLQQCALMPSISLKSDQCFGDG